MIPRLLTFWHAIRSSLWALPLAMIVIAVVAALFAIHVKFDIGSDPVWYLYSGDAKDAPQFLSGLLTAMITMATLAISITMVVLALAAQQLGPRLILSFMGNRTTQAALGLFTATVVYLLLVLRTTYGASDTVPNLAVTIGTALVFLCIIALLIFVHHLANSIISDNVIIRVGAQLDGYIDHLMPPNNDDAKPAPAFDRDKASGVALSHGGYVQMIDYQRIAKAACDADAVVEIGVRGGHHVIARLPVAWISGRKPDEQLKNEVLASIIVGPERTSVQDLEFSIRQLVEIAERAASPGINDSFTAIAVADRLTRSISKIMARGDAPCTWQDADGKVRVIGSSSTFDGIVEAAFNQLRQCGDRVPALSIRIADNLCQLAAIANPAQRKTLMHHLDLLADVAPLIVLQHDQKMLEKRIENARAGLCLPRDVPDDKSSPRRKKSRKA